jgi:hypothetical protein
MSPPSIKGKTIDSPLSAAMQTVSSFVSFCGRRLADTGHVTQGTAIGSAPGPTTKAYGCFIGARMKKVKTRLNSALCQIDPGESRLNLNSTRRAEDRPHRSLLHPLTIHNTRSRSAFGRATCQALLLRIAHHCDFTSHRGSSSLPFRNKRSP